MTTTPDSGNTTPNGAMANPDDDAVQEAVIIDEPAATPVYDELIVEEDDEPAVVAQPAVEPAAVPKPAAEHAAVPEPVVERDVPHASATEPVIATDDPAAVRTEAPAYAAPSQAAPQQVVYVQAPSAPRKLGNRGVGVLIAALSALVFVVLLAGITAFVQNMGSGRSDFGFLSQTQFYIPMLFFVVAFILLVLLVNRGAWWAYIIGSVLVALVVYFGTIGLGLLTTGVISNTPAEANARFVTQLSNPFVIASALLAREVSLWFGALISRRGRSLKARNAAARESYERELAERRAQG